MKSFQQVKSLTNLETEKALTLNILAGSFGMFWGTATTGTFLAGFALAMGASEFEIGLVGALPFLAGPAQLLASYVVEQIRRRKFFWMITCGMNRAIWYPILLIPLIIPADLRAFRVEVFLGLFFLCHVFGSLSAPVWLSWVADLIPAELAGRYWTKRAAVLRLVAMMSSVSIGYFLDLFPETSFKGFAVVFGLAATCGVIDVLLWQKVPEPTMSEAESKVAFAELLQKPFKDPNFRRFLAYICGFRFSIFLMAPFVAVFLLKEIKMNFFQISFVTQVICTGVMIAFTRFWGYLADKYGHKPVLSICSFLRAVMPVLYLFVSPLHPVATLIPLFILVGISDGGLETSTVSMLLGLSPRTHKSMFVAMFNSGVGLVTAIAPILGGAFLQATESLRFTVAGLTVTNFHILFISSGLLRFVVQPLLTRVEEPKSIPTAVFIRRLADTNPFRLVRNLYALSSADGEAEKLKAARTLGDTRSSMAVEELVEALDDPSREVREEAALALGKIGDSKAIEALAEKLLAPDSDIQSASARALGQIGHADGVEPLLRALERAQGELKIHVATALGEIGDVRAAKPLLREFSNNAEDAQTLASVAEALSKIGEVQAIRVIIPAMRAAHEPLIKRQFAIAIGNLLGKEGEFYAILSREARVPGKEVERLLLPIIRSFNAHQEQELGAEIAKGLEACLAAYQAGRWQESVEALSRVCIEALLLVPDEMNGKRRAPVWSGRLAFAKEIEKTTSKDARLSADLWYIYVLSGEELSQTTPACQEEALLAIYAFYQVFSPRATVD